MTDREIFHKQFLQDFYSRGELVLQIHVYQTFKTDEWCALMLRYLVTSKRIANEATKSFRIAVEAPHTRESAHVSWLNSEFRTSAGIG